jgi:hypothetical protein
MKVALRTRIKGNTSAGNRVDWGLRPQAKDLPAIRLTSAGTQRGYTMGGAQDTQIHRIQADCYGLTFAAAHQLGEELIALLEPPAGDFQASFVLRDDDRPEKTDTGEIHCRSMDFQITHVSA